MTAEDAVITAAMALVFLLAAWAMLAGGTGPADTPAVRQAPAPATGRHRAPDTDALPFRPGPHYRDIDDWTADLATAVLPIVQLAAVVDRPRHTSPSDRVRGRCEVDTPIFAALAKQLGYDPVCAFDAELVAA